MAYYTYPQITTFVSKNFKHNFYVSNYVAILNINGEKKQLFRRVRMDEFLWKWILISLLLSSSSTSDALNNKIYMFVHRTGMFNVKKIINVDDILLYVMAYRLWNIFYQIKRPLSCGCVFYFAKIVLYCLYAVTNLYNRH